MSTGNDFFENNEACRIEWQDSIEKILNFIDSVRIEPLNSIERIEIINSFKTLAQDEGQKIKEYSLIERFELFNSYLNSGLHDKTTCLGVCLFLAQYFSEIKDSLMTCHFINLGREFAEKSQGFHSGVHHKLAKLALNAGHADLAVDLVIKGSIFESDFSASDKNKLDKTYKSIRSVSLKQQTHGHDLLLSYLQLQPPTSLKGKTVIEIGTTRENVPGQGSTRLLAELCKKFGMKFITVDMDPNNGFSAHGLFKQLDVDFEAITMKGEDYLRSYEGQFDYIFLDAYDFDHGMHSELRQERYLKYLGREIDESLCHQMHLECAVSLVTKLSPEGIICFDDAWQNELGDWLAKGTLAIPYLLSHGFETIEARNKAVLMRREII